MKEWSNQFISLLYIQFHPFYFGLHTSDSSAIVILALLSAIENTAFYLDRYCYICKMELSTEERNSLKVRSQKSEVRSLKSEV
jgi:hypothetical protein